MKLKTLMLAMNLSVVTMLYSQDIRSIDSKQLEALLNIDNDTVYVVNFWATWCSPCVKEIPYFSTLQSTYSNSNLQVILVNLDFPNQVESRVIPFLNKNGGEMTSYHMSDMDYNKWIPLVSEDWSGAIPATLIFKGEKRQFIGEEVTLEQLEQIVMQLEKD